MKKWNYVIAPKTGLFDLRLGEIWQYRSMIWMLMKRNYQIQYKQTILGAGWIILGPIFSSGLFSFVFGYVGQFSSDGIPYFPFYMTASIFWGFFSGCVERNTSIFQENADLFGKVYFPRLVIPLSNVLFEMVRFLIQFLVCAAVCGYFVRNGQVHFMGGYLMLLPFLVLEFGLMGMTLGMLVSSLTIRYRDLNHMVHFGMQLLLYISPVLYPVSRLPSFFQKLVLLNPVSSLIESFRFCMTGSGTIHPGYLGYSTIVTILLLLGSLILFNQTEKTSMDLV